MPIILAYLLAIIVMIPYGFFILVFRLVVGTGSMIWGIIENVASEYIATAQTFRNK